MCSIFSKAKFTESTLPTPPTECERNTNIYFLKNRCNLYTMLQNPKTINTTYLEKHCSPVLIIWTEQINFPWKMYKLSKIWNKRFKNINKLFKNIKRALLNYKINNILFFLPFNVVIYFKFDLATVLQLINALFQVTWGNHPPWTEKKNVTVSLIALFRERFILEIWANRDDRNINYFLPNLYRIIKLSRNINKFSADVSKDVLKSRRD